MNKRIQKKKRRGLNRVFCSAWVVAHETDPMKLRACAQQMIEMLAAEHAMPLTYLADR